MADNPQKYGLRWNQAANGGAPLPKPMEVLVADATAFDVSGGQAGVALGAGDPVKEVSTGGVTLAQAGDALFGVVIGVEPYWDGTVMKPSPTLPSGTSYGTNLSRQSKLLVVPITAGVWEMDCDDKTTATTEAGYQAFINENADIALDLTSGNTRPYPRLDISTHGTGSAQMRIVGISKTAENQDFSGLYVKLLVVGNEVQNAPWQTTGV